MEMFIVIVHYNNHEVLLKHYAALHVPTSDSFSPFQLETFILL